MIRYALKEGPVWALGTMSGTSLDGVDAALVLTDGQDIHGFGVGAYRPYEEDERETLRAALGRWDGLEQVARLVEGAHLECLAPIPGADVVGFHGQTTAHDPGGRGTCQIGDGARLAHALDLPVVWDFRSADVAAGGQGAPLAPFFHHAALRYAGIEEPTAILNLGGVGNLTWADPRIKGPAEPGACMAFDTGPANAPLNDLMRARRGLDLDAEGALAAGGTPDAAVLERLRRDPFFALPAPKSLDRDAFAWLADAVATLSDADAAATLTAVVAESVKLGLRLCPEMPARILVTGGGRLNPVMMVGLRRVTNLAVEPVEEIGLDGDMLEAQAFGYLAVRVLRGLPTSAPATTGAPRPICGGRVSEPGDFSARLGQSAWP
ncbi:anhydro-N-acetylmuramic acid kinase [Palleronia caenipelagi]|uniref:Anhydro-N-acetylmuramic acid kinase n=1 Tax=Palleronia caenipelagi TaxID=2489174 RepID=A0A547Q9B7_9RHOB|nr:anhydro-N-acetylmuramic acid kinase [Palleronia caenipelagi]TRD22971.1 anhydro-N-acetylmuramic acid kinase [Palleronia caenipelagi]